MRAANAVIFYSTPLLENSIKYIKREKETKTYSNDLRKRVIDKIAIGKKVDPRKGVVGRRPKLTDKEIEKIDKTIKETPDITLEELRYGILKLYDYNNLAQVQQFCLGADNNLQQLGFGCFLQRSK